MSMIESSEKIPLTFAQSIHSMNLYVKTDEKICLFLVEAGRYVHNFLDTKGACNYYLLLITIAIGVITPTKAIAFSPTIWRCSYSQRVTFTSKCAA